MSSSHESRRASSPAIGTEAGGGIVYAPNAPGAVHLDNDDATALCGWTNFALHTLTADLNEVTCRGCRFRALLMGIDS